MNELIKKVLYVICVLALIQIGQTSSGLDTDDQVRSVPKVPVTTPDFEDFTPPTTNLEQNHESESKTDCTNLEQDLEAESQKTDAQTLEVREVRSKIRRVTEVCIDKELSEGKAGKSWHKIILDNGITVEKIDGLISLLVGGTIVCKGSEVNLPYGSIQGTNITLKAPLHITRDEEAEKVRDLLFSAGL